MSYGLDTIIFGVGVLVLVIVGAALLGVGGSGRAGGPKKVYNLLGGIAIGSGLLAAMVTAVVYFSTSSSQAFVPYTPQVFPPTANGTSPWGGKLLRGEEDNVYRNATPGWRKSSRKSRKTSRKTSRKN